MSVKLRVFSLVLMLSLPAFAIAQSREGACYSPICILTGGIIVLLLVGTFFLTLAESVFKHGLLGGIIKHKGVQVLSLYLLGISALIALTLAADALFGKNGAVAFLLITMVVVYALWHRFENKRESVDSDTREED